MLKNFGFAVDPDDPKSEIIVELFEDQFEEENAAVKSLMEVLKKLKASIPHDSSDNNFPTSTCLSWEAVHTEQLPQPTS